MPITVTKFDSTSSIEKTNIQGLLDTEAKVRLTFSVIWVFDRHRRLIICRETSHDHKTSRQSTFLVVNTPNTASSNIRSLAHPQEFSNSSCVISWIIRIGISLRSHLSSTFILQYGKLRLRKVNDKSNERTVDPELRFRTQDVVSCLHFFHLTFGVGSQKFLKRKKNQTIVDMFWEISFAVMRLNEILKCHLCFHWVLHY